MNKPWLGYFSSVLLLFAGILMIAGSKTAIGITFIVLSIVSVLIKIKMGKKNGNGEA